MSTPDNPVIGGPAPAPDGAVSRSGPVPDEAAIDTAPASDGSVIGPAPDGAVIGGPASADEGALGPAGAGALVFGASAAVLVVEIASLRLLAPYLGLTLETSTLVIGIALAAIALGAWSGGQAADAFAPRRILGPLLAISGVAVATMPFAVRAAGEGLGSSGALAVAIIAILVPATLLSAVPPMVVKLRLTSLDETGSVVGRLSGLGTLGAIAGTVLTGFVFVAALPVSTVLLVVGACLMVAGLGVGIQARNSYKAAAVPVVLGVMTIGAALGPGQCDAETVYHCADVRVDPARPTGRLLVLDGLRHSYVDLDDPTHLEFPYMRALGALADTAFPAGQALAVYHLGGGGFTFPTYLDAVRPGTSSVVSEIDRGVVELGVEQLGLITGPDLEVRVEDARLGLQRLATDSRDLIVGDAFGGISVPWHLTTREAVREVRRVVRPNGVYAVNLIDWGPLMFARAELATLREAFDHVALASRAAVLDRSLGGGGNLIALASDAPLDLAGVREGMAAKGLRWELIDGAALDAWIGDAAVLTDDHAPVDQLLTTH